MNEWVRVKDERRKKILSCIGHEPACNTCAPKHQKVARLLRQKCNTSVRLLLTPLQIWIIAKTETSPLPNYGLMDELRECKRQVALFSPPRQKRMLPPLCQAKKRAQQTLTFITRVRQCSLLVKTLDSNVQLKPHALFSYTSLWSTVHMVRFFSLFFSQLISGFEWISPFDEETHSPTRRHTEDSVQKFPFYRFASPLKRVSPFLLRSELGFSLISVSSGLLWYEYWYDKI